MPTDVEQRATATSSGVNETPAACRANAPAAARTNETKNADDAEPERLAAERAEVELGAGQEQQERDPEQGEEAGDVVDVQPAQHLRPDEDPGDDLQHDRRDAEPREEAERERHGEREHRDAEQIEEVLLRTHSPSEGRRASTRPRGPPSSVPRGPPAGTLSPARPRRPCPTR